MKSFSVASNENIENFPNPVHAVFSPIPNPVIRRLKREFKRVQLGDWPCFTFVEYPPTNFNSVEVIIIGPPDSPYAGGEFHYTITYPEQYPFRAPRISVNTRIYHPFIQKSEITYIYTTDFWSPAIVLSHILSHLHSMLTVSSLALYLVDPCHDTILNEEARDLFVNNRPEFLKKAAAFTRNYAQPSFLLKEQLSSYFFPQGTPFLYAVYKGHVEIAKLLLDAGADIHAKDYYGNNALILSIHNLDVPMVQLLVEYKINVKDTRSGRGESLVELLMDTTTNEETSKAQDEEIYEKQWKILILLQRHGLVLSETDIGYETNTSSTTTSSSNTNI